MKEFSDFGAFAAYLKTLPKLHESTILKAVEKAAEIVEFTAKDKIGTYQTAVGPFEAWIELSERTKEERVSLGYSENDPLYRTGALRESISHEINHAMPWLFTAVIGSDSDIAVDQELGTGKIPPRAFLGPSLYEHADLINNMLGNASMAVLSGNEFNI